MGGECLNMPAFTSMSDESLPQNPAAPMRAPKKQAAPNSSAEDTLPPDADLDERFREFWKRNGVLFFGGLAMVAVIVVIVQIVQYVGNQMEASAAREFGVALSTPEALASYAESHAGSARAGLAHLELAHQAYEAGNFGEAATLYAAATEELADSSLAGRAALGEALSRVKIGEETAAKEILQSLSDNAAMLNSTRAEAAYNLAVMAWEAGDIDGALALVEKIEGLEDIGIWEFRAADLRDRMPMIEG